MAQLTLFGKQNEAARLRALRADRRIPHAIMLTGAKGMGKKFFARWCAMLMLCENENAPCMECRSCHKILNDDHPDVIYAKGEKYTADSVREIVNKSTLYPNDADIRIVIFEDCDEMNEVQQNILLKAIEEPSSHNRYIFTCENTSLILSTIISRVVSIPLSEMTAEECRACLVNKGISETAAAEHIKMLGTNPGKILSVIADKKQIALYESAARIAEYIANGNEYETARELALYSDREEIFSILYAVYEKVCSAVKPYDTEDKTVKELRQGLSVKKLYALTRRIEELTALSDFNVNARVFAAYCSSRMYEIIADI
ncbi:MAG: hypothetical protein IKT78_04315 [Ruminiclostridium sp.]|nr:hypothetical protein [Ruminiclostridium sp.]